MNDLQEKTKTVEIPPNTGIDGFIHVVREVVKQPRVQKVIIDKMGRVTYTQLMKKDTKDEEINLNVSFDHLQPYHVIRNARTQELSYPATLGASAVIGAMFDAVATSGFTPIAFVVNPTTILWSWIYFRDELTLNNRDNLFGYPLLVDKDIPEAALVLCAGVDRTTALIDTKISIKVALYIEKQLDEEIDLS